MRKIFQFEINVDDNRKCWCPLFDCAYDSCSILHDCCEADLRKRPDNCPLVEVDNSLEGE